MPPSFFSVEFHTRFFPALIRARLKPQSTGGTVFVPHNYIQGGIALLLFIILLSIGVSSIDTNPLVGWTAGIIGAAGIIAILIYSIYLSRDTAPSYDTFLFGAFSICVVFWITAGIFISAVSLHFPVLLRVAGGLAGLVSGYCVGIWVGLYMQKLGFVAYMLEALAIPVIVGMIVVDILLMFAG